MHRCWNWGDSICVNLEVCLVSFFDLIVHIDLFSITNYTITAIAVEPVLGTLRSEDGDGRKNFAEKVNPRSFNLHRDYSKSLTLSNVGEPS